MMIFTSEMDKWLRENREMYTRKTVVGPFNAYFGASATEWQLRTRCEVLKAPVRFSPFHYSDGQIHFLLSNYDYGQNVNDVVQLFNAEFGSNIKEKNILHFNKKYGLRRSKNTGRVVKGKNINPNILPVGAEVWNGKDLYIKISNDVQSQPNNYGLSISQNPNYKRKSHIVWEKNCGAIPDDSVFIFLDGNHKNCDFDNLYLASRKILGLMLANKWYYKDQEITITAIKWCEHYFSIKNAVKEGACQ